MKIPPRTHSDIRGPALDRAQIYMPPRFIEQFCVSGRLRSSARYSWRTCAPHAANDSVGDGSNASKLDFECGPAFFPVGSGNPTTITAHDLPSDGQAQSHVVATSAVGSVGEEPVEDARKMRFGDAGTGVGQ